MREILINHTDKVRFSDAAFFIGRDVHNHNGVLTYQQTEDGYELLWLSSSVKNGGRSLVQKFCETVGGNQAVFGTIREDKTWQTLINLQYAELAASNDLFNAPIESSIYPKLRIWWVLSKGGIKDLFFNFTKEGLYGDYPLTLNFSGKT